MQAMAYNVSLRAFHISYLTIPWVLNSLLSLLFLCFKTDMSTFLCNFFICWIFLASLFNLYSARVVITNLFGPFILKHFVFVFLSAPTEFYLIVFGLFIDKFDSYQLL